MSSGPTPSHGRLVLFELGPATYALPIEDVVEVSEPLAPAGIPTLPRRVASVVNLHGEPLPVVSRHAVLGEAQAPSAAPAHLLVVGEGPESGGALGLPVDRVVGIVPGPAPPRGGAVIAERREIGGRVVTLLDARALLASAREAVEREAGRSAGGGRS